ncbi:hypothetical protein UPYG_G00305270 [Umbra pygmaea]|uniref:Uncharacterized protein n=1 Tax=Umbra pygmaea TaxID=75934 RepID=A0ABD0VZN8_UMBPY
MNHFQWQSGSSQKGIPCKIYTTTSFCSIFNINRQLLPIFAALAGNDYVSLNDMGFKFNWGISSTMKPQLKKRLAFFQSLLKWLTHFQGLQEALSDVPTLVSQGNGQHDMDAARQALSLGMEVYQLPNGHLQNFFIEGKSPGLEDLPEHLKVVLPAWTPFQFMKGRLGSSMLYILLHLPVIQGFQVEDYRLASGNITSRPIRQVFYGLLLGEGKDVMEYDREGRNLTNSLVKAVLPRSAEHLHLHNLNQDSEVVRLNVLLETLAVSTATLSGVVDYLRLPVAVTSYWMRMSQPKPDQPLIQALLLGWVYGQLFRQSKSQPVEGPFLNNLGALIHPAARRVDLGVAHAYSQWQACLRDSLDLNQLLFFPLPEPECAWLYKGPLVHQLVARLRKGETVDSLLDGNVVSGQLYKSMLDAVLQCTST